MCHHHHSCEVRVQTTELRYQKNSGEIGTQLIYCSNFERADFANNIIAENIKHNRE